MEIHIYQVQHKSIQWNICLLLQKYLCYTDCILMYTKRVLCSWIYSKFFSWFQLFCKSHMIYHHDAHWLVIKHEKSNASPRAVDLSNWKMQPLKLDWNTANHTWHPRNMITETQMKHFWINDNYFITSISTSNYIILIIMNLRFRECIQ